MKRKLKTIQFRHGLKVVIKESSDEIPLGIIIDVFCKDELLDTLTYWYSDYEK